MSADREILELAAKAAGMTLGSGRGEWTWWEAMQCFNAQGERGESRMWNPLTDDGDALRLAVNLGMEVYIDTHPEGQKVVEAVSVRPGWKLEDRAILPLGDDPYAATRRAIVRAAAQIGSQQ